MDKIIEKLLAYATEEELIILLNLAKSIVQQDSVKEPEAEYKPS